MRIRIMIALAITIAITTATIAVAAPAANDDIADATPLTPGVEQRFSTIDATIEATEEVCDGNNTVWFSFTAPSAGEYAAYATGSDHDTEIGWSNAIDDSTGSCPDDASDSYDAVEAQRTFANGEQEYVQMSVDTTDNVGTGGVGVTAVLAAANTFASATDLTFRSGAATAVRGIEFAGTETTQTGESTTCGSTTLGSESAWLDFVAPSSGSWMFEAKSQDDTDIAVYSGSAVNSLTLLNCATEDHIAAVADLAAGATYRVRVVNSTASAPVVVRAERAPILTTTTRIDTNGGGASTDVGTRSDLAIVAGRPATAYYDATAGELRYASRNSSGAWSDVLIDANGGGASTDVGDSMSIAVLPSGEPAVAYHDSTNGELRYATRSGGTWTDTLIDANGGGASTDVGDEPSLIVRSNGSPAVAYYDTTAAELRYASRNSGGTWSDVLIDANGDGTSTDVGHYSGLVEFSNGNLGVSYVDDFNSQLRFARRTGTTWSDETVYDDAEGDVLIGAGTVLDSSGNPVTAATDSSQANHVLAWWNGTSWDIEWDNADRHVGELDFDCTIPQLLIDGDDAVYLPWTDCNYAGTLAVSVRNAAGSWSAHDITAEIYGPQSSSFAGTSGVWDTWQMGAAWLPDGRMAVTFQYDDDEALWYGESALLADAGADAGGPSSVEADFNGSGSSDQWGEVASYAWSGAPAGCAITGATTATPSITCTADTTGEVTLTVTDTDGFTHSDTAGFEVLGSECDTTPDPFTDVPANSFARADVTCIYNLGVTTGTSPTTYSPALPVTREQMAAFLARLYKSMTGADAPIVATPFTDVRPNSFAKDSIGRIYGLGITTGTSPTKYSPLDRVTREQMAAFLARLYLATEGVDAPIVATPFTDVPATSFAKDSIARIYGLGITTGTSPTKYSPANNVTREQMASFLARLYRAG